MNRKTLKNPTPYNKSGHIGLSPTISYESGYNYPVFCLKYLHKNYDIDTCVSCSDRKFLKGFVKKLKTLSDLSWTDIQLSDCRGHGAEKIASKSIKPSMSTKISEDVKDFLSFRFAGDEGRIIGFRSSNIFHITFIDIDLTVYDH